MNSMRTAKTSIKSNKSYHHGDLKKAVTSEAVKILQQEGDAYLTLRELARRLGVTHAAVYRHFKSRKGILANIAEEGFQELARRYRCIQSKIISSKGQGAETEDLLCKWVTQLGDCYVYFALEHPGHFRAMFHPELNKKIEFPKLAAVASEAFQLFLSSIGNYYAIKNIKVKSAIEIAIMNWSFVHGLATLTLNQQFTFLLKQTKTKELTVVKNVLKRGNQLLSNR